MLAMVSNRVTVQRFLVENLLSIGSAGKNREEKRAYSGTGS